MQPPSSLDPRVTTIVRKHAHDVRNYINSLDLECSFLEELLTDPDAVDTARRMRVQLRQLELVVKSLSVKFAEPRPLAVTASDLLQLWKHQVEALDDKGIIEWSAPAHAVTLTIDSAAIVLVLREQVMEAWARNRAVKAAVRTTANEVIAELVWPSPPGAISDLDEHRRLVEASGGKMERSHDDVSGVWQISLTFPGSTDVS
ncbi:MAG: hypothetical protein JWO89_824 [Verrucomicrobiaceae bacterium]|nr:hypothetical protein [Verrucomicrobiaceae bacterium]MDB6116422.1 hypothetical protein [Verrucomicrobiaceae bacterium]